MPYVSDWLFNQLEERAKQYDKVVENSDSLVEIIKAANSLSSAARAATSEIWESENEAWRWREGR